MHTWEDKADPSSRLWVTGSAAVGGQPHLLPSGNGCVFRGHAPEKEVSSQRLESNACKYAKNREKMDMRGAKREHPSGELESAKVTN